MVNLVREKRKEVNGLLGVAKEGGEKQRLILNARRVKCPFIDPEYPELSHRGLFRQL